MVARERRQCKSIDLKWKKDEIRVEIESFNLNNVTLAFPPKYVLRLYIIIIHKKLTRRIVIAYHIGVDCPICKLNRTILLSIE